MFHVCSPFFFSSTEIRLRLLPLSLEELFPATLTRALFPSRVFYFTRPIKPVRFSPFFFFENPPHAQGFFLWRIHAHFLGLSALVYRGPMPLWVFPFFFYYEESVFLLIPITDEVCTTTSRLDLSGSWCSVLIFFLSISCHSCRFFFKGRSSPVSKA